MGYTCTTYKQINVFTVKTILFGCELNFTILVEVGGVTEGAELALYKKTEPSTGSHLRYYIFIAYKKQSEVHYSKVVGEHYMDSDCKSWQVFNISSIKDNLPVGVHKINLLVAVFKETDPNQDHSQLPLLSCSEVKSLFIMDTSADLNEFNGIEVQPEMPTVGEVEVDAQGVAKASNNDTKATEDNKSKIKELGSGGGNNLVVTAATTTVPTPIQEEAKVEDYLPAMVAFVSGGLSPLLKKRSVGEPPKTDEDSSKSVDTVTTVEEEQVEQEDTDVSSGANCRLLENKISLPTQDPNILDPDIVNKGKCSDSTDAIECRPTGFQNLDILVKINELGVTSIKTLSNFIITECTPFINTQSSVSDLTTDGSNSQRKKRLSDESPKTDDQQSDSNKGKYAAANATEIETETETEPEPEMETGVLEEEESDESSGMDVICRLHDKKISLSAQNPNIVHPDIVNVGRCSDSTDTVECRPTGFRDRDVLVKKNGFVVSEHLEDFIITECTPFDITQSTTTTA